MESFKPATLRGMVVVSNPHLRRLLTTILNAIGLHEVMTARTAREAIQTMTATPPDFIICTQKLDDADGTRLARAVRAAPQDVFRTMPVVLFLEEPTREQVDQARAARVSAVMTLPTSIKAVYGRLAAIFGT